MRSHIYFQLERKFLLQMVKIVNSGIFPLLKQMAVIITGGGMT